ncbi:hypothetical protein P9112_008772 [Eukaryota sp. TZLM1-RC]
MNTSSTQHNPTTLPTELLAEFLSSILDKDYTHASSLLQQLLTMDPHHPTLLEYAPILHAALDISFSESSDDDNGGSESTTSSEPECQSIDSEDGTDI